MATRKKRERRLLAITPEHLLIRLEEILGQSRAKHEAVLALGETLSRALDQLRSEATKWSEDREAVHRILAGDIHSGP